MDVVALSQFGWKAWRLGHALTPNRRGLHRFAPEVYIAYDGDRRPESHCGGWRCWKAKTSHVQGIDFGGLDPG